MSNPQRVNQRHPDSVIEEAARIVDNGQSIAAAARAVGVPYQTLIARLRKRPRLTLMDRYLRGLV